jgi:hypothetical protein
MKNTRPTQFSTIFWLMNKRKKGNKTAIYLRITVNNKRVEIATGHHVAAKQWNQKSQCATGYTEDGIELNKQLAIIKADVLRHYNRSSLLIKSSLQSC